MTKALVAMSGGVDSSVAALLMLRQGYDCTGATMKLFDNADLGCGRESTCCSLDDVADARAVAFSLGMTHHVFNFTGDFRRQVMSRFTEAYLAGETPNPCIDCNRFLKFERFLLRALELGFDRIATGHYARTEFDKATNRWLLKKALDETKDQSYVLYTMTQQQLASTVFPLGELTKPQVRQIAAENGLINAKKHDSQDICFVPDGDYAAFIERQPGVSPCQGDFILSDGTVLARHDGYYRYTIGQRRGLKVSLGKPLYVTAIDPVSHSVTLGENDALFSKTLSARDINLISISEISQPLRLKAKLRYRHEAQWALVTQPEKNRLLIEFDEPQRASTRGQAVVLYDGDIVVGGGTIV